MPELTYTQLTAAVARLEESIARDADEIRTRALLMEEIAQDTGRVAEMIGSMKVDPLTVGETRDLARIMLGISEVTHAYASAADTTAKMAAAAGAQARTTHAGIDEAVSRAPVDVSGVNRSWFAEE